MPANIEITSTSGGIKASTQNRIRERLEEFVTANRRTRDLQVTVDDGNPNKPMVEIIAQIGTGEIAGKASARNVLQAVEDALEDIQGQRSQRRDQSQDKDEVVREDSTTKIVGGVASVLLAGIFGLLFMRMDSCTYNPANYPETAPVTGTVTLDGAPLEGATIRFAPDKGRSSNGKTDSEGKYELKYTGAIKGAMLGNHRVELQKQVPDPNYSPTATDRKAFEMAAELEQTDSSETTTVPAPLIDVLPERYRGKDSELWAEVKDGDNVVDFALTSE